MSISRQSTYRWSSRAAVLFLVLCCGFTPAQTEKASRSLPPFLDEFRANTGPSIVTEAVGFTSAGRAVRGHLARPGQTEALPALLLIGERDEPTQWLAQIAGELAGIGYVVLAVERGKAEPDAAAALRWLQRRTDVIPAQIGIVGWGSGAEQALALAAATRVQACVCCDLALPAQRAQLAGLRKTPVLVISAGNDPAREGVQQALAAASILHENRVFAGVASGFMKPHSKAFTFRAAEEAWVEIYNFLGKHVEDAPEQAPAGDTPPRPIATIADIMRVIVAPTGVRGALTRSLESPPQSEQQWKTIRAQAALVAEAGQLLDQRRPAKGMLAHWHEQVRLFTNIAGRIVAAADQRDHPAAARAVSELAERCAVCHEQHR